MVDKYYLAFEGITLDYKSCQKFQYDEFKEMVLSYGEKREPKDFNYTKIFPQRDSKVMTKEMVKKYIPVCQKGIITKELDVLPFGYNP